MGTACGAAAEGTNKCTESFSQNVAKKNTENRSTYSYERITLTWNLRPQDTQYVLGSGG